MRSEVKLAMDDLDFELGRAEVMPKAEMATVAKRGEASAIVMAQAH